MAPKVKLILNGCGGMGCLSLKLLHAMDDVEIVGLVDISEENARRVEGEVGLAGVAVGVDLDAVLKATRPDVVFDCSIPEAHHATTLKALARGCHVIGEKPLADSMEHAREMVDAARRADRLYAVIQNRRYMAEIRRLKRFLASGAIGRVTTVNCDFYLGAHFGGFRDEMEHPLLLDMAIHTFDQARLITGADPLAVYCREWNPAGSWYRHGASAQAIFEMTGGLVYNYRGSWCSEGLNTTWESNWHIIGEKGSVLWDGGAGFQAQVVNNAEGFHRECVNLELPELDPADRIGGHEGVLREFIDCVQSGAKPETIATDNIKSLSMVFGAIQSADTGQRVLIGRD